MGSFKDKVHDLLGIAIPTFGEAVTYRPKTGGSFQIQAVFDNEWQEVDPNSNVVVSSNAPRLGIRLRDFPSKPIQGDCLVAEGKTYQVVDVQEDGQGGASLFLHKAEIF